MSVMRIEFANENTSIGQPYFYSYLDLPASNGEITDAMHNARIFQDQNHYNISVVECDIDELTNMRIDSTSINELNFLAKRLTMLSKTERIAFTSLLRQKFDEIQSIKELINNTYGLDGIPVWPAKNAYQYGEMVIENGYFKEFGEAFQDLPDEVLEMLDRHSIGEAMKEIEQGVFINGYYVVPTAYETAVL